jgi:hypothetical protein
MNAERCAERAELEARRARVQRGAGATLATVGIVGLAAGTTLLAARSGTHATTRKTLGTLGESLLIGGVVSVPIGFGLLASGREHERRAANAFGLGAKLNHIAEETAASDEPLDRDSGARAAQHAYFLCGSAVEGAAVRDKSLNWGRERLTAYEKEVKAYAAQVESTLKRVEDLDKKVQSNDTDRATTTAQVNDARTRVEEASARLSKLEGEQKAIPTHRDEALKKAERAVIDQRSVVDGLKADLRTREQELAKLPRGGDRARSSNALASARAALGEAQAALAAAAAAVSMTARLVDELTLYEALESARLAVVRARLAVDEANDAERRASRQTLEAPQPASSALQGNLSPGAQR